MVRNFLIVIVGLAFGLVVGIMIPTNDLETESSVTKNEMATNSTMNSVEN